MGIKMKKHVGRLIMAIAIATSTTAAAKELMIGCTVHSGTTRTGNSYLDDKVNGQKLPDYVKHYILDDVARSIWVMQDGKRQPACVQKDSCTLKYSAITILMQTDDGGSSSSQTQIDRMTGAFLTTTHLRNSSGVNVVTFEFPGNCKPESVRLRKF